LNTEKITRNPL